MLLKINKAPLNGLHPTQRLKTKRKVGFVMPLSTSLPQVLVPVVPRCLHCGTPKDADGTHFCSDACRAAYAAAVAATLKPLTTRILSRREKREGEGAA